MSIILDLVIIAIVLVTAILSAKRGFVRTATELVGFIAAVYLAFTLSVPAANFVYNKMVEPALMKGIEEKIAQASTNVGNSAIEALPDFIENNLDKFGVDANTLSSMAANAAQPATVLSENVIEPMLTGIFKAVFSILIFIIFTFVVKLLAKLLNKIFSFSLVGALNKTLGFVLGTVKGLVFASIFCAIVVLIASVAGNGFLIFSSKAVNGSFICGFLTNLTGINIFSI
jgi:uncharacterized membrane protein required for colicin V production